MKTRHLTAIIAISFLSLVVVILGVAEVFYLQWAHSSFDNYYKFRGCVSLVSKTDDHGYCKLADGQNIKIVKYHDKWYLDGDLPQQCGPIECP